MVTPLASITDEIRFGQANIAANQVSSPIPNNLNKDASKLLEPAQTKIPGNLETKITENIPVLKGQTNKKGSIQDPVATIAALVVIIFVGFVLIDRYIEIRNQEKENSDFQYNQTIPIPGASQKKE